jgi:hypothetical protein
VRFRRLARTTLALAAVLAMLGVQVVPARASVAVKAKACCGQRCHKTATAPSCRAECCVFAPATGDTAAVAPVPAPQPATATVVALVLPVAHAPAGAAEPHLAAPQRAGPVWLRTLSLRL